MDALLIRILEHPKDFISVISMVAVVYLLKALRDDQRDRLLKFEATLKDLSREVNNLTYEVRIIRAEQKEIDDLTRNVIELKSKVEALEVANGF